MGSARKSCSFVFLFLCVLTACSHQPERRYDLNGKIIAVDASSHELTIQHQDVPGLMKGMTMPFRVKDSWVFNAAKPGDSIRATLVIAGSRSYLENISLTEGAGPAPNLPGIRMPQVGDTVPDFAFTNQDGKTIHLAQFRGKTVLLTFIYTRCPLPDYCIRMSSNFNKVGQALKQQPSVYDRTEQLSISFDPKYDTPKVLRAYGENYAGDVDPKFTHWEFVSGTPEETKKAADFFGLSYMPDGTTIVHSLRTAIIGPDGKIAALFNGNDWQPDDAVQAMVDSLK